MSFPRIARFILFVVGSFFLTPLTFSNQNDSPSSSKASSKSYFDPDKLSAELSSRSDLVQITQWPQLKIDLKYSSEDNFLKKDLYGDFNQVWLHKEAANKLKKAQVILKSKCLNCQFVIYDALRPRRIQKLMWEFVVPIKKTLYVANPKKGSVHNFGFAIDLSIVGGDGVPLDMGTPYDSFKPLAQPRYEDEFLKQGKLTQDQLKNRLLLRSTMQEAGFYMIFSEWWHFNALPGKYVRENYSIIE